MNPPAAVRIGIFARTFNRPTLREVLAAVRQSGFGVVQLNLSSAGLPTVPSRLPDPAKRDLARAMKDAGVGVAAISGTFNLLDSDARRLEQHLRGLGLLAELCAELRTPVLTLSTGTADPRDMWRAHPDNQKPESWQRSKEAIGRALRVAEPYPVKLAIEPEAGNVVRTTRDARRMLDEVHSRQLGIVLDGANLAGAEPERSQDELFAEAVDLLGGDIALVHAKESATGAESRVPGRGSLNWRAYLDAIDSSAYAGPLILHGMAEQDAVESREFLRAAWKSAGAAAAR